MATSDACEILAVGMQVLPGHAGGGPMTSLPEMQAEPPQQDGLLAEEADHRLANAYHSLCGLVDMAARHARTPAAAEALERVAGHVRAFQAAHQLLRSGQCTTPGRVDAASYLDLLCAHLRRACLEDRGIALLLHAEPVLLRAESARHLGLIVNELVLNAAKHAFPDGRAGTMTVRLARTAEGGWRCTVTDDGVGLRAPDPGPLQSRRAEAASRFPLLSSTA